VNVEEIQVHGPSRHHVAMVDIGSGVQREVTEYWLTEAQAYVVCRHSNVPNAAAVNKMLIDVFMAWRRGQLVRVERLGWRHETCRCGTQGDAATDSDGKRPPNPIQNGHRFRSKAATAC
jgi:hypothetical protein